MTDNNEAPEGDEEIDGGEEDELRTDAPEVLDFDLALPRKAISAGIMTADEAVKHWNLTAAEAKALGVSGPGRAAPAAIKAPETELAELRALTGR